MARVNLQVSDERLASIDRAVAIRGASRTEFALRSSEAIADFRMVVRGPQRTTIAEGKERQVVMGDVIEQFGETTPGDAGTAAVSCRR